MSCTKPLIRFETWETYKTLEGKLAYKADIHGSQGYTTKELDKMRKSGNYRNIALIPCGKCIGCRLDYARDKAVQLSLEAKNPIYGKNECWFLTLTYDDLHLKTKKTVNCETGEEYEGVSTDHTDLQEFWKRLRDRINRKYPGKKIQYLNVTEYGEKTNRPHAHAIVFGLPLDTSKFVKHNNNMQGDALWESLELIGNKTISEIWGHGNVSIGEATFQSMSYVARYTLKKTKASYDEWWYKSQGKEKEWISMSQNIGKWYYDIHKDEIYEMDCVPVLDNHGQLQKPPRSYDRFYKRDNPKKWKEVQKRRQEQAETQTELLLKDTDLKEWEIREVREELSKQYKDIRRTI